jgi:predicted MPP superfamily phosphohydrolase
MHIRYLSDIHLELLKQASFTKIINSIKNNSEQICVLSGDIGNPYSSTYDTFMKHISNTFKKTFVITGNHEYYNNKKTVDETNEYLTHYFKTYNNISFLNNSYEIYENYLFVGTTLWSKITNPEYEINDAYCIKCLNYISYNKLNQDSLEFLDSVIDQHKQHKYPLIIITHHMPSKSLIDSKYKTEKLTSYNQWFYSDMDKFILDNKDIIKCWFYGHTHMPSNTIINDVPFCCNPIGYLNENKDNNFDKTLEL